MKRLTRITLLLATVIMLTACQSKYNVKVDLTPEERQAAMQVIEDEKLAIANYEGEEGTIPFRSVVRLA